MLVHKGTRTIETSRLILRETIMDDIEPMYRNWASDLEVTKYLTWPAHANLDVTKSVASEWIKGYSDKNYYQWMIVLKDINEEGYFLYCGIIPLNYHRGWLQGEHCYYLYSQASG